MVLDVRHLNKEVKQIASSPAVSKATTELPLEIAAPPVEKAMEAAVGLKALIGQAISSSLEERLGAIQELRQLVPNQNGIDLLWQIVEEAEPKRRLVAAQLLAYHRHRLNAASMQKKLWERLDVEKDPQIVQALVRALRQQQRVKDFLLAAHNGLAKEAALGVPLNSDTLETVVRAVHQGHAGVARILLERLEQLSTGLGQDVCEYLIHFDWSTAIDRLEALLKCLPQVQLFMLFIEYKGMPQWDEKEETLLRQATVVEQVVSRVLRQQPGPDLVSYLLQRGSEDPVFARRHAPLVKQSLHQADAVDGAELLKQLKGLSRGASDDKLAHLAQILVELSARLEGTAADQATALLEDLKRRSPALKLKIYHLQQGWA